MSASLSIKRRETAQKTAPRAFVSAPPDLLLFASVASLVAIGLAMIFSASSAQAYADHHDTAYFLKRQIVYLAVGLVLAYGAYRVDYRKLRAPAPYLLVLCGMGLIAVLVPHVGVVVNGARRWIGAGPVSLQPSEFAKLGIVLYLSAVLSLRGDRITSLSRGLFPLCVPVLFFTMLVFVEPDMGTASLIVFTSFAIFFAAGARFEHLLLIVLATVPPAVLAVLASPYKRARIFAFVNPWKDAQNTGFHIVQSLLALGSGGFFGVGLGESRAKFFYLPEQYTDFIFSVLGEELGLIGTVAVVVLFLLFGYRAIRIAIAAPDRFGFFLATGCAALIVIQAFVNIGVVTSSWPVTGVPLPFISFGGSSLIVSLVAVALVLNVGRYQRVNLP
ncbi:MAG TPA: putative lipid II flippase FtsW [Candidatus Baltobacteraceae bacterium]|jgi:cell division protein FtsW|nr:putative lipid II flippase FtsW [Candidatus Baltobacteraceae bacterium]